jgi:hypothetical protein
MAYKDREAEPRFSNPTTRGGFQGGYGAGYGAGGGYGGMQQGGGGGGAAGRQLYVSNVSASDTGLVLLAKDSVIADLEFSFPTPSDGRISRICSVKPVSYPHPAFCFVLSVSQTLLRQKS